MGIEAPPAAMRTTGKIGASTLTEEGTERSAAGSAIVGEWQQHLGTCLGTPICVRLYACLIVRLLASDHLQGPQAEQCQWPGPTCWDQRAAWVCWGLTATGNPTQAGQPPRCRCCTTQQVCRGLRIIAA